jgi:hypothetical protein
MNARNDLALVVKVQGLLALMRATTGEDARAVYYDDHVEILLTPDQQARLGNRLAAMMGAGPGRIRIDVLPIIGPALLQKFGLIAAVILGVAYMAGRISKH